MHAKPVSQTLRLLSLAALFLAAGVFAFRATEAFSAPPAPSTQTPTEQQLVYLLEPYFGEGRVRVSHSIRNGEKSVILLLDGPEDDLNVTQMAHVETVLANVIGFDPQTDRLSLSQFEFATGTVSPQALGELGALGLIILILSGILFQLRLNTQQAPSVPEYKERRDLPGPTFTEQSMSEPQSVQQAARLIREDPNEAARLIRSWMKGGEAEA